MSDFLDDFETITAIYRDAIANGGASIDPDTLAPVPLSAGRYFVAVSTEVSISVDADEIQQVEQFQQLSIMAAQSKAGACIGLWVNGGKVIGDVSVATDSLDEALRIGADNNQLAIYDAVEDREIRLQSSVVAR